jgi:hypothetical protein
MQSKPNSTIAVDLAKSVFEVAVSHRPGAVAKRLSVLNIHPLCLTA